MAVYEGRTMWKGGLGSGWEDASSIPGVPVLPAVPFSTRSSVGLVERMGRAFALALLQTGDAHGDSARLLDFAVRRTFLPDLCAQRDFPTVGGVVGPDGPILVTNFALDRITGTTAVTAVIDDRAALRLDTWRLDPEGEQITRAAGASATYALPDGGTFAEPNRIETSTHPTPEALGDFLSATLAGQHLDLKLWRVGEGR